MKKLLISLVALLLAGFAFQARAAVTETKYRLVYNAATCRYDVFLIVGAGSATTAAERKTYTAQVSLVIPSGTTIGIFNIVSNEPKVIIGGTNFGPGNWAFANFQAGSSTFGLNGSDVYSFVSPTSNTFYTSLNTNDTILLFSIPISSTQCGSGIRLWTNNKIQAGAGCSTASPCTVAGDPTSTQFNLKDFNNGHGFYSTPAGAAVQTYTGNASGNTTLPKPTFTSVLPVCTPSAVTFTAITPLGNCATSAYTSSISGPFTGAAPAPTSTVGAAGTGTTVYTFNKSTVTTPASATFTITVTNSNNCSTAFTRTYDLTNCTPLSVKLAYFRADANRCAAELSWATPTADADFERFDVQYSDNGKEFVTVGSLPRNPYNEKYSYSFDQTSGKGYYRLKIVDLQGKVSYSGTQVITTACDGNEITISPNPTITTSVVNGLSAGDQVKVSDMLGNVVANYISGGTRATIDISNLASGVYNVMVTRENQIVKAAKLTKL